MKIMVVGPGTAGMTTLVHRILTGEFTPGQFTMTDGISMKEWKPISLHLPGGVHDVGDIIILNPQSLADVFRCVITCSNEGMIRHGILLHNQMDYVWSEYEPRLHQGFLCLLHQCELAYEIFDSRDVLPVESLVPSLLPNLRYDLLKEVEIRDQLLPRWNEGAEISASVASDPGAYLPDAPTRRDWKVRVLLWTFYLT
jgi:hypothetical protein